jgi:hypothetical protein
MPRTSARRLRCCQRLAERCESRRQHPQWCIGGAAQPISRLTAVGGGTEALGPINQGRAACSGSSTSLASASFRQFLAHTAHMACQRFWPPNTRSSAASLIQSCSLSNVIARAHASTSCEWDRPTRSDTPVQPVSASAPKTTLSGDTAEINILHMALSPLGIATPLGGFLADTSLPTGLAFPYPPSNRGLLDLFPRSIWKEG